MDNSIVVFQMGDKVGRNQKKTFRGHVGSGYACQPAFSPDGRFLGSGDGDGNAWFWDWRTNRVLNKFKAHDNGPSVGMSWHPLQPSWVATCGWDGVIKLWD
jgi:pre-mRNA-processing factor 17